jgi:hypothetical protein
MRTRTLIILALITFAVLAYIQFFAGQSPGTYEKEVAARQVMNLVTDDINHIEITSPKGSFVFNRDDKKKWQMQSPIKYPANSDAISSLLSQLSFVERKATLDASQLGDLQQSLSQFGLKAPETVLKLKTKSGDNYELDLGKPTAVAGASYARIVQDGQESYIVVEQSISQFILKGLDQWRSSTVFDFTTDQVRGLTLHLESKDVEIKRDNGSTVWKISKPLAANADENEMRSFLANLLGLHATQFVTDNSAEYAGYNLNSPYLVLDINLGKENVSLRIGRVDANNETKYYAQQTSRPAVFVIQKPTVDMLAGLLDAVRDRRIMRVAGTESILSIAYQKGPLAVEFDNLPGVDNGWALASVKLPADMAEVQTLLTKLGNARAGNYQLATDENRAALGLKNPVATITFKIQDDADKKGPPKVQTLKFAAPSKGEMAVESSFRDDIVTVPADVLLGLPDRMTDWLSRTVRLYSIPAISSVTWKKGEEITTLAKDEKAQWPQTLNGKNVDQTVFGNQLSVLSGIRALRWREVSDKEFANPALVLTVAKDKEQKVLSIIHDLKAHEYTARLDDSKYGFVINTSDFDLLNLSPVAQQK